MRRRWLLSLLCLALIPLSFLPTTNARGELKVDASAITILLQHKPVAVQLVIENSLSEIPNAKVHLELLDPRNHVAASADQVLTLGVGKQTISMSLPLEVAKLAPKDRGELLWYRLVYRITGAAPATNSLAAGIVSLSQITPDLFETRVAASELAREGMRYRARVQAVHPITQKPAADVRIDAVFTLETDDEGNGVKRRAAGITDADGYAVLNFDLPARFPVFPHQIRPAGGSLKLIARRGGLIAEAEDQVMVDQFPHILVSTDKPLYQPGQRLHLRALVLSPTSRVLRDQNVIFRVSDPEDTDVFRQTVKSSRFGIASVDWAIPDNVKLGDYQIRVALGGADDSSQTYARVRISRYDLPNFTVKTQADRTYYIAGQNAEVKISADYLFGQRVTRGHVRVVRETERRWNYAEQKWDVEEGEKYEGETDAAGVFLAHIDLAKDHEEISDEDYRRFRDFTYAAYFTDPTTNRTEQRRFELRVTREPIHVYVIRGDGGYHLSSKLPLHFYVSTFYADGTPAQCRVTVSRTKDDTEDATQNEPAEPTLATVNTNRYGLAIVNGLSQSVAADGSDFKLTIAADDLHGKTGSRSEEFRVDAETDEVRLETDKPIYAPGDPITLSIASSVPDLNAVLDVANGSNVLISRNVQLHGGRATVTIPYQPEFKDQITIAAYQDFTDSRAMISARTILFPVDRELNVEAQPTAATYRPGEDAQVSLRVRGAGGSAQPGALGVVIVDKAVDERFRSDQEFGSRSYGFYGSREFSGSDDQVAGFTFKDLQRLALSGKMTRDLEIVAEVLLNQYRVYYPTFFGGDSYERDQQKVFGDAICSQLKEMKATLAARYAKTREYPNSAESLRRLLGDSGIDFDSLRDPWGNTYRGVFSTERENDVLSLSTAGADKRFGTADDITVEASRWLYFRPVGAVIDNAVRQYHERTGGFIRDLPTLRLEVGQSGLDWDSLRDRWGQPYRVDFDIAQTRYVVEVRSSGPDKKFSTLQDYSSDDFAIWSSPIDYFAETRKQIDVALDTHLKKTKQLPRDEASLQQALRSENPDLVVLKDPWGQPFYTTFTEHSFYGDRATMVTRGANGQPAKLRTEIKPVTETVIIIRLRSDGPDAKHGTSDDFDAATFSGLIAEQASDDDKPRAVATTVTFSSDAGGVVGEVKDALGAAISNVAVSAKNLATAKTFETKTDEDGKFLLRDLPAGPYLMRFTMTGFKIAEVTGVFVTSGSLTEVIVTMEAGAVSETVTVTAEAPQMQTSSAAVNAQGFFLPINGKQSFGSIHFAGRDNSAVNIVTRSGSAEDQISTPRLREYFPETLLWQPSIETDKQGRAQIKFKLADNITTWKMSVIGSNENGEIGTAETEITAFQPFFVEHDPPRVLTEGDQLSLPVVLRNYLTKAQTVDLEMKPENWFALSGPARQRATVPAGDSAREIFDMKIVASIKDGKQRVTATGPEASDAIEKPVTVHPDGEETSATASDIIADSGALDVNVPADAIANSTRVELKIYPNLMAHVIESVEAIMSRPYGCGEQTISSTYPSLLIVRDYKRNGQDSSLRKRAERYLQDGYSRLLNYRNEAGGFTYWGRGEADLALTAYALRFLSEARDLIAVDDKVIGEARAWLAKQQAKDGSFPAHEYWNSGPDSRRTALMTAYVAHVLAMTQSKSKNVAWDDVSSAAALKRALDYLAQRASEIDEPYLLAAYALAAFDAGDAARATPIIAKLRSLTHQEGNTTYWSLETNTPFYGWGLAGRVETTALVIQALVRSARLAAPETNQSLAPSPTASQTNDPLIRGGLLFLLKQKDRYGVWYSTQATINVLDTMMALLTTKSSVANGRAAQVLINGRPVQTIQLPNSNQSAAPITVDIGRSMNSGSNRIEIKQSRDASLISAQAVVNYYVPWSTSSATRNAHAPASDASALRLTTTFDKHEARVGDEITCRVKTERVGFHGYGMMLAEIGLPPGADVDRASLETAMTSSEWAISQYDILPDRVVVYLWPRAGGIDFTFKFRPRFALKAKSAPATIYDYYNPEARAVIAPTTFTIR